MIQWNSVAESEILLPEKREWERSRQALSYKGVSGVTVSVTSVEVYRDVHGSDVM